MSFKESRKSLLTAMSAAMLFTACSQESAESPAAEPAAGPAAAGASAVDAAIAALGMENLGSITYSGTAWRIRNSFMQTPSASPPWPSRDTITNYTRTINLANVSQPVSFAKGETFAQNLFFAPAVAGTYTQYIPGDQTAWGQQLEVWLTPWGFLKGADAYDATEASQTLDNNPVTAVTWTSPATQTSPSGMRYTVTGYINSQNEVQQVETWVQDPFLGDMHVVALYSDYTDFNGLKVPATMEQQRGGGGIFGVNVTSASINPANVAELLTPPAAPAPATPPPAAAPPAELAQQVGEGVYYITGGYGALAVEFTDYIAVFEAGQSEARGQQILDEVKRLFPDKPIRYLINSHPHSDHTAGMVPFVREGATIITHSNNVAFLDMALSTPRTLLGEETLMPVFQAAESGVTVLEDAMNRIELHYVPNDHSDGMLVGVLPMQGIMIQADFTLPQGGAAPNPFVVNLAEYVDANGVDFEQYLAVHQAQVPQTKADLMATIGK